MRPPLNIPPMISIRVGLIGKSSKSLKSADLEKNVHTHVRIERAPSRQHTSYDLYMGWALYQFSNLFPAGLDTHFFAQEINAAAVIICLEPILRRGCPGEELDAALSETAEALAGSFRGKCRASWKGF